MRKLEAKEQKKKNNRMLVAILLLLLLGFLGILSLDFDTRGILTGFNHKLELMTPLPQDDPIPELTKLLIEQNIPVNFPLIATESSIIARLTDDGEVWFSQNKNFASQVNTLQIIIASIKTEDKKIKRIDLRFERPSVVY